MKMKMNMQSSMKAAPMSKKPMPRLTPAVAQKLLTKAGKMLKGK